MSGEGRFSRYSKKGRPDPYIVEGNFIKDTGYMVREVRVRSICLRHVLPQIIRCDKEV